ncbi:MAG TPA: FAD-dependent oxidoreductase, partial [Coxiellaceae bacterium]|nr:FAD-dependent oxidoreductase [Coxiellaceae bacterium]
MPIATMPFDVDALDQQFIAQLTQMDKALALQLHAYRKGECRDPEAVSEWIIATAPILENFIAKLFQIENEVDQLRAAVLSNDPIFQFKSYYLQKAKHWLKSHDAHVTACAWDERDKFTQTQDKFTQAHAVACASEDFELSIAKLGCHYLTDTEKYKNEIETLIAWCAQAIAEKNPGVLFHLPQKKNYENLVPMTPVPNDPYARFEAPIEAQRHREGFQLTDQRMSLRDVLDEVHYCVYCHKNDGDFCSKGFPVKKNQPELGLKKNPLDDILTGCPLEEKISEMNFIKKQGYGIAALAIVTIDNPMCAATGHRICNDCMKACIYQKQDPVDIPQIETRVLTDVLHLPFGVEIYDLLIRWNPLRHTQFLPKKYNHKKVLVMGMGPAGFTLAHHLLMEGCAVVGFDGLKIEPLSKDLLEKPIRHFSDLIEPLDDRVMAGFGGVAEYGITVRWDKNFLKLIYLSLARRQYFQVFGNTRFGGTLTVEKAWELGFDHVAIAVGAGLPRELHIPNSLAPGMRQANDFLMALQLTGAIKKSSLANLQMRLPAVIIGGGLTGVDTATEAQAYYVTQVEKMHQRYHILKNNLSEEILRAAFDQESLIILDEFLSHAEKIMAERALAQKENRLPRLNALIREWGGVTIAYRKKITESPAYQCNHEELIKALEEGIYYAQDLEPVSVTLDFAGNASEIICKTLDDQLQTLPAKSIFVATGAKPNIAYEYEHRGTFQRDQNTYESFIEENAELKPIATPAHIKEDPFGIFTSYEKDNQFVSFIGDTHPLFHGSVVKAIASAMRGYPKIMDAINATQKHAGSDSGPSASYATFRQKIKTLLDAKVVSIARHHDRMIEITVHAPLAAQQCHAGQFYRLQNYETLAPMMGDTRLQTEAIAALGIFNHEKPDHLSFFIEERGASTRLVSTFKVGDPIALMGPTGAKIKMPDKPETVLIIGDQLGIPFALSVAPSFKQAGCEVIYASAVSETEMFAVSRLKNTTHEIISFQAENSHFQSALKKAQHVYVIG